MKIEEPLFYQSPLATRYASKELSYLFSPHFKYATWRRLWIALAKAEKQLGLSISAEQIAELEAHAGELDLQRAAELEKLYHHEVVAHIHAFAELCPKAKPIIHLGATSAFVMDNTDLIQMKEALSLLLPKMQKVLSLLADFADKYRDLPCLAYTHLQPAQPTTLGKRFCLWAQDFLSDYTDLQSRQKELRFLGVKGATGTQASFLTLFRGDHKKTQELDLCVSKEMGFDKIYLIASQTYPRKEDARVLLTLASFAASAHKFATDLRLLAHENELAEPFGSQQVGSSAMPHKHNPILAERICALSRLLISLSQNPLYTAATQWLERSLDDSANRRVVLPEAFLTADAILELLIKILSGLQIYPMKIKKNLQKEIPFLALENILMEAVSKGKDRQEVHELLRQLAHKAKEDDLHGKENTSFSDQLLHSPSLGLTEQELTALLSSQHFIGCAPQQVELFLQEQLYPALGEKR